MSSQRFAYGGQAVLEGVMIRGRSCNSLAVRLPDGSIHVEASPLPGLSTTRLRRVPFLRGPLVLLESLVLGTRALSRSANLAVGEETDDKEMPPLAIAATLGFSLAFGIFLFFLLPLFAARASEGFLPNTFVMNVGEGLLRLGILLGYIWIIGKMEDIRRVFAYHGAEHMAVHAHEHGLPLVPESLRRFPTMHPRCGTAFLLVVAVVALVVFTTLGKPGLLLSILSRVVLIPVIAALSYEVIRWSGKYASKSLARFIMGPSLALQKLTTRQPEQDQLEVAIAAMEKAIQEDETILRSDGVGGSPTAS